MAVNDRRFTRVPPESTGDRVNMIHTAEIQFSGGYDAWQIGEHYTISGGGGPTMMVHVHGVEGSGTSGHLSVHYSKADKYNEVSPVAGQDIIDPDGVTLAGTVVDVYDLYIQANNIMGWDNPSYGWNIDRFGSGQVRFGEGPAELSSFNQLRTSQQKLIAEYLFLKDINPAAFSNALIGSATVTHEPTFQAVKLEIGDTLNDQATHTSNLYHPALAGSSTIFTIATRLNSKITSGLVQNWGAFDATDGFFFQQNGSTLNVVHRKTFEGSTTDSAIAQDDWNKDKLDGTGSSGMTLDVTKSNLYWIDYQYLGGGRIRWGVYYLGERVVCHEMYMENKASHNAISNPNRPICWALKCINGAGYTGNQFMYAYGASVYTESTADIMEEGALKVYDRSHTLDGTLTGAKYVFSARPVEQINGLENHSLYLPKRLQVSAFDSTTAETDRRVEVRAYGRCILRGESYSQETYTTVEFDTQAEHLAHGQQILEATIKGDGEIDLSKLFHTIQEGTLKVNAETTTSVRKQPISSISTANPATLTLGANPITGQNRHLFDDRNQVTIRGISQTGPNSLNDTTVYLAFTGGNSAILYANLADLDDDRVVRELTLSSTTNVVVGDTITVTGAGTAVITALNGSVASVEGRTDAALDVGLGSSAFTTTSGGAGNVTSVALQTATFPRDYETTLGAVDGSGWAGAAADGDIEGTPPSRSAWTFMIGHFVAPGTDTKINAALSWKERIQ